MRALEASARGTRRALAAPGLLLALWLINLFLALPAAFLVGGEIHRSVADSQVAERLLEGFDNEWQGEFAHRARGLAATFRPTILGVGALLENLELWLGGELFLQRPALVVLGAIQGLLWILLLGGVLERMRSAGPSRGALGLVESGRIYFWRFLRLTLWSGAAYYGLYRLARWLFPRLQDWMQDVTRESTALLVHGSAALILALLLLWVRMITDYARIAMVVDGRRSSLGAWLHGLRFVTRHPIRTWGVELGFVLAGVAVVTAYAALAPGAGQASAVAVVAAFLAGQLVLLVRLTLRVARYGAEIGIYEP